MVGERELNESHAEENDMKQMQYPTCANCGAEINPNRFDDCEKYYMVGGEIMCKVCFKDWLLDWIETNMDDVAELAGVPVVEVR